MDFRKSGSSVSFSSFIPKVKDLPVNGAKCCSPIVLATAARVSETQQTKVNDKDHVEYDRVFLSFVLTDSLNLKTHVSYVLGEITI